MADEVVVVESDGRPEGLPEKFKTVEDMATSYAAAEAQMHRQTQQIEQERAQFQAALQAQTEQQQQRPIIQADGEFDPDVAAYEQAYERGDTAAMLRISTQMSAKATVPAVAQLLDQWKGEFAPTIEAQQSAIRQSQIEAAEGQVSRLIGEDEYKALVPKLRELISDHPNYLPPSASPEGYANAILDVVKIARYDQLVQSNEELTAERNEKLAAQQLGNGGNRSIYTKDEQEAFVERIKNTPTGSFDEIMRRS